MTLLDTNQFELFTTGNEKAFRSIFLHFQPQLHRFAAQLIKDVQAAEDIVSEVFLKVWHRHADFPSIPQLQAFLYTSVRNGCYNHLRNPRNAASISIELAAIRELPDLEDYYGFHQNDLLAEVFRHIEQLSPALRKVMLLKFKYGKDNGAIAAQLGITPSTVETHIRNGKQQLRKRLQNTAFIAVLLALFKLFP